MKKTGRPTREDLLRAENRQVADIIRPGLMVLFCGINPGLYSGAVGHHFARPGNRFWKALFKAGLTPELLSPSQERWLLDFNLGITNFVNRATARADSLSGDELRAGKQTLVEKVRQYQPRILTVLGLGVYGKTFEEKKVQPGDQKKMINRSQIWVLPNPSGLNANYQLEDFVRLLKELRKNIPD